jgi:integrase
MPRMSHLIRRNGIYWFKADLPDDLAGKPFPAPLPESIRSLESPKRPGHFKTAIWKSLRTSVEREAKRKLGLEIALHEALYDAAREFLRNRQGGEFSSEKAQELAEEYRRFVLTLDEVQRQEGLGIANRFKIPIDGEIPRSTGMAEIDFQVYSRWAEEREAEIKRAIARFRVPERIHKAADTLLLKHRIEPATLSANERRALEFDLMAAERRAIGEVRARLEGEDIPTPHPPQPETPADNGAWTISKAFRAWAEGGGARGAKKPAPNTVVEAEAGLRRFIEFHGDMPIRAITKAHGRAFRDAIAQVPKGLPAKLRALPLKQLLEKDLSGYELRRAATINKTLILLGAVLARAEQDGYFDQMEWRNPFEVTFKVDPTDEESYEPFTATELNKLFASPVFADGERPVRGRGETAKWAPLVALLQGARRGELLQLFVRDIAKDPDSGIWTIRFDRDAGKTIKTVTSIRRVPVHPHLIKLGFLDFVRRRVAEVGPDCSLWPEFEDRDVLESRIDKWGEWFGDYLAKHVVDDPAKSLHSFRGTFKRFGRGEGLDEIVINHLVGHSNQGVGARYGRKRGADGTRDSGYPMTRLAEEIGRVQFDGVDFSKII